jgi:hypothetical protein
MSIQFFKVGKCPSFRAVNQVTDYLKGRFSALAAGVSREKPSETCATTGWAGWGTRCVWRLSLTIF